MKKLFLFLSLILLVGCRFIKPSKKELIKNTDSLITIIKNQQEQIHELELQIDIMQDELRFKESEISYWGHKYDSCSTSK